jgi:hypothetical protein
MHTNAPAMVDATFRSSISAGTVETITNEDLKPIV